MQSLHSAITPPAPPAPRQLANFPTSRKVGKSKSWQVGKHRPLPLHPVSALTPPEPRIAAKRPTLPPLRPLPLTPPVDLTRPNVPPLQHWSPPRIAAKRPTSTGAPARIVHTSSHPRPLAPRQLANFPTSRKVGKSESRKVGTHHHPPRTGEPPRIVVSSSHPLPPPYPRVNRAAPCILHPPPAAHSTTPYRG